MRIVYGIDDLAAQWVASRIPIIRDASEFGPCAAQLVVDRDERPVAGLVWNNWSPRWGSIELSAASDSPRWLSRALLAEIFSYPFLFCGCQRVATVTPASNERAIEVDRKIGFLYEGRARRGFGDEDAVLMGLLRDEWLAGRYAPRPGDAVWPLVERFRAENQNG